VKRTNVNDFYVYELSTGRQLSEHEVLWPGISGSVIEAAPCAVSFLDNPLTPDERREIAEYMTAKWQFWAVTGGIR
jgi:hypothetical protein